MLNQQPSATLFTELQNDQLLLDAIKAKLLELEKLRRPFDCMYEDGVYRFYHHSFKVYSLQDFTLRAYELFQEVATANDTQLCDWYEAIGYRLDVGGWT